MALFGGGEIKRAKSREQRAKEVSDWVWDSTMVECPLCKKIGKRLGDGTYKHSKKVVGPGKWGGKVTQTTYCKP